MLIVMSFRQGVLMKFAQTYFLLRILPIHVGILTLSGLAATGFLTSFCLILVCLWVLIFCLPFPFHPKQMKHCLGINLFWEHDSRVLKRFLFWNGILFFFLFFGLGIREAALSVSNYFEKGKKLSYKKVMCELLCMEVGKVWRWVLLYFASYCPF